MKKIFAFISLMFVLFAFNANAQTYLYCADYAGTDIRDTVAVNGSTDAGSGWFLNAGYSYLYAKVYNGASWRLYEVVLPTAGTSTKFMLNMEGSDTTISVRGYLDGESVDLPIVVGAYSNYNYTLDLGVTAAYYVEFIGYKKWELKR